MSGYTELPMGIALIPCDTLIEDRISGKKSLIGIIGKITASSFPFQLNALHLLVSLTSGHGEYPCQLELSSARRNEVIFSGKGTLKFKDPSQVVDLVFVVQQLHFNYPDTYWIKFLIDGVPLMMRPLFVDRLEKKPQDPQPPEAPNA